MVRPDYAMGREKPNAMFMPGILPLPVRHDKKKGEPPKRPAPVVVTFRPRPVKGFGIAELVLNLLVAQ
jgi:hypothetical protein